MLAPQKAASPSRQLEPAQRIKEAFRPNHPNPGVACAALRRELGETRQPRLHLVARRGQRLWDVAADDNLTSKLK